LPLTEAIQKAKGLGLDLVEVSADAKPPVVRILDFKKYSFVKKRQQSASKKKTKTTGTKEIRFRPSIGPNDLQIRTNRARKFLEEGNKVKLTVQFRGRQITHPEIGFDKINGMIKTLSDVSKVEQMPRKKGKFINAVLGPRNIKTQEH